MRIIASFAKRELKCLSRVNCSIIPNRVHIIAKHAIKYCFHQIPNLIPEQAGLLFMNLPIKKQSMKLKTLDILSRLSKLSARDAMPILDMYSMMDPSQRDFDIASIRHHSYSRKKSDYNPRNHASCSSLGPALRGSLSGLLCIQSRILVIVSESSLIISPASMAF